MKSFEAALFPLNKQLATPGCKKSDSIKVWKIIFNLTWYIALSYIVLSAVSCYLNILQHNLNFVNSCSPSGGDFLWCYEASLSLFWESPAFIDAAQTKASHRAWSSCHYVHCDWQLCTLCCSLCFWVTFILHFLHLVLNPTTWRFKKMFIVICRVKKVHQVRQYNDIQIGTSLTSCWCWSSTIKSLV